jgi:hypothetical protein
MTEYCDGMCGIILCFRNRLGLHAFD